MIRLEKMKMGGEEEEEIGERGEWEERGTGNGKK